MARILIVEDEPLIALMLEDWLTEMGHQPVGPADSIDQALEILDSAQVDAAILDINIRSRRSDSVADVLLARGTPLAFATGGSSEAVGERFAGVPTVRKPYDFDSIRGVVDLLTSDTQINRKLPSQERIVAR
jgi:DNA-binding response OmpR family regulator